MASLNGRGAAAEAEALRSQLAAVTGERDQMQAALRSAMESVTVLTLERNAARTALAEAESAVTDFEARVRSASISLAASASIPVEDLPAISSAGEDPAIKLRTELAATSDPVRRGQIAAQLLALRAGNN